MPGSAGADDFPFEPVMNLMLTPHNAAVPVSGRIIGDRLSEGDESFTLVATISPGQPFLPFVFSQGGTVTIVDDDQARASRLHVEGATVLEGDQGVTHVDVRVRLEPAAELPVRVHHDTVDNTATVLDGDYQMSSGDLAFAPGEVEKSVTLSINGDRVWEPERPSPSR
jgi:Calx-beta domain